MNHLQVRCPSCAKLYQVDVTAIFSASPHFQCQACPTLFTFDFPPENPLIVHTRPVHEEIPVIEPAKVAPAAAASPVSKAEKVCPRCGRFSPKTSSECLGCGVLFEKLEGLPTGTSERVQPSLVRRWKELLENYNDDQSHQSFIMACKELDALDFATRKYDHLKRIQGQDEIATQMLSRISALQAVKVEETSREARKAVMADQSFSWRKAILVAPFLISVILILWGFAHAGQRNMIGAGIACALLSYGLIIAIRGRLSVRDFFWS